MHRVYDQHVGDPTGPGQTGDVDVSILTRGMRVLLVPLALSAMATACGGTAPAAACGPTTIDQLATDEGHLIANSSRPPTYQQNPPTSGPHIAGLVISGAQRRPLTGVEQVSTLETGAVVIQYRHVADRRALEALTGDGVTVAPQPVLPAAVVATGWQRTMRCDRVDIAALHQFISTVRGRYAGHATTTAGG